MLRGATPAGPGFQEPLSARFPGASGPLPGKGSGGRHPSELERLLLEPGAGFAFITRHKRIHVDKDDYRNDLLFYHLRLRSSVVVDVTFAIVEYLRKLRTKGVLTEELEKEARSKALSQKEQAINGSGDKLRQVVAEFSTMIGTPVGIEVGVGFGVASLS
jgi:hypothetical protein